MGLGMGTAGVALESGKLVGARVHRVEDPKILRGQGRYVPDLTAPGMLHVAFLRSPHAHARILRIEADAARRHPGVAGLLLPEEAAAMAKPWRGTLKIFPNMKAGLQHPLALGVARFAGEPIVAVAAADRYAAEDAVDLLRVEYEVLPAVTEAQEALAPGAPVLHEDLGDNLVYRNAFAYGDPDGAFAQAPATFRQRFRVDRQTGIPLEGRGLLAQYDAWGRSMTVWTSTQVPHMLWALLAEILGIEEHRLRIICPEVGGGFGIKAHLYPDEVAVCLLAMRLGRPAKWVQDRHESFVSDIHARDQQVEVEAAVAEDGRLLAMRSRIVSGAGAYSIFPRTSVVEGNMLGRTLPGPYRLRDYAYAVEVAATNKPSLAHYRGVGHPPAVFITEVLMDVIARGLSLDPAEVRRRNLIRPDEYPFTNAVGALYDIGSHLAAFEKLLEAADYAGLRREQAAARAAGRLLGIGFTCFVEMTAPGAQFYGVGGAAISAQDGTTVRIEPSGKVTALVGTGSQGQGLDTTYAQVIAQELGVGIEDITVISGDTAVVPYGGGSWGSRSAVVGAGSATLAARAVREKALAIAGHLLEANPADLDLAGGRAFVKGSPQRGVRLAEVAWLAYYKSNALPKGMEPGLDATRHYDPPPMTFTNGSHLAVAEIDPGTGQVGLRKYVAVEDCGRVINPMIVEGQMVGGIAQGVGEALFEHLPYDGKGQPLATNLMDYLIPGAADLPPIDARHIETPSPLTVGGYKGVGEAGAAGAPGAVANAINDALAPFGVCFTHLPIMPEQIAARLQGARLAAAVPVLSA